MTRTVGVPKIDTRHSPFDYVHLVSSLSKCLVLLFDTNVGVTFLAAIVIHEFTCLMGQAGNFEVQVTFLVSKTDSLSSMFCLNYPSSSFFGLQQQSVRIFVVLSKRSMRRLSEC